MNLVTRAIAVLPRTDEDILCSCNHTHIQAHFHLQSLSVRVCVCVRVCECVCVCVCLRVFLLRRVAGNVSIAL